ncbi:hypothetical protein Ciccas_009198 [Cichlidogyrus casuarinus]|uniref:Uncharacterized protein n=1 Tax=Cichlidogyrus casuarinus TaxID=1844966 RepID=A0ABD2Q270_9PLAT
MSLNHNSMEEIHRVPQVIISRTKWPPKLISSPESRCGSPPNMATSYQSSAVASPKLIQRTRHVSSPESKLKDKKIALLVSRYLHLSTYFAAFKSLCTFGAVITYGDQGHDKCIGN